MHTSFLFYSQYKVNNLLFRAADEEWMYEAEVSHFLTHSSKCETWKGV